VSGRLVEHLLRQNVDMAQGWDRWVKAPGGGVIAEFGGPDPSGRCAGLDILLWAETRAAALKRARSLGLHGVQLQSPGGVPDEDVEEIAHRSKGGV
jgi:hypothetical protein